MENFDQNSVKIEVRAVKHRLKDKLEIKKSVESSHYMKLF